MRKVLTLKHLNDMTVLSLKYCLEVLPTSQRHPPHKSFGVLKS